MLLSATRRLLRSPAGIGFSRGLRAAVSLPSHHPQAQSLAAVGLTGTARCRAGFSSSSSAAVAAPSASEHLMDPPFSPHRPALPAFAPAIAAWRRPYSPGPLSPSQLQQFYEWGYVLVRDVLSKEELGPAMSAVEQQVDDVANALWKAGRLRSLCADADFFHRLTLLEQQFPSLSVLLHKQGVLPREVCSLWGNAKLLSIAQQLIGPDIAAHPNWSLRTKTPHQEQATVPWHQDAAYLDPSADQTLQLTAWIPFLDATVQNGCMQVVRGGHRAGVVVDHTGCAGSTWYIETVSERMQQSLGLDVETNVVTVPVPLGSVLLLNNLIPHRSLNNASDEIRWSIDLRWQRPDRPSGYALKPLLPLTKKDEPGFRPDWEHWRKQDRHVIVKQSLTAQPTSPTDDFDTTIVGVSSSSAPVQQQRSAAPSPSHPRLSASLLSQPWMSRWPLTHHNRHTRKWEELRRTGSQQEQQAAASRN